MGKVLNQMLKKFKLERSEGETISFESETHIVYVTVESGLIMRIMTVNTSTGKAEIVERHVAGWEIIMETALYNQLRSL